MERKKACRYNIVINEDYESLRHFVESLPEMFDSSGRLLFQGRNTLRCFSVGGVNLVVKSFAIPKGINKMVYGYIRTSKAYRSFTNTRELRKRGFVSPVEIAYIEEYCHGLLNRSYYVSLFDDVSENIVPYVYGQKRNDALLKSLAEHIGRMHQSGVLHYDLSPGNVLVSLEKENYCFSLVDVNRMTFKKIKEREGYKNFNRLCRSKEASTYMAQVYADFCGYNKVHAVKQINSYSDKLFSYLLWKYAMRNSINKEGLFSLIWGPCQQYLLYRILDNIFPTLSHVWENKKELLYEKYLKEFDLRKIYQLN